MLPADSLLASQCWQELSPDPWQALSQTAGCMQAYAAQGEEPCPCTAEEPVLVSNFRRKKTEYRVLCKKWNSLKYSSVLRVHHSGLLLCNVPQSHDGISMDFHGKRSSCSAVDRQDLCDWFKARRMASITQNLQEQAYFLGVSFSNSLCKEVQDGLMRNMRN